MKNDPLRLFVAFVSKDSILLHCILLVLEMGRKKNMKNWKKEKKKREKVLERNKQKEIREGIG